MHSLIPRKNLSILQKRLESNPSVALLGARQVGKSTLAQELLKSYSNYIYLDLERASDLNQLNDPETFFQNLFSEAHDILVCIDEIQLKPQLFSTLRSIIDNNNKNGQFLFLGSASRDLIKQSSETLAGRISYMEISPFSRMETKQFDFSQYWLRGGYPRSILSNTDEESTQWRLDYIRTFLERDIPLLGFSIPTNTLSRFWRMLAHSHGEILNSSKLSGSMGVSSHTIRKYIDLLEQTFVIRALPPFFNNGKKRLIKSPKIYIRDTGILHSLLDIESWKTLFQHPVYGTSFEALVIENVLNIMPNWRASFYRTSNGEEIDLVLEKGLQVIAIEIKASTAPKTSKGFRNSLADINATHSYIVGQVKKSYPYKKDTMVVSLDDLLKILDTF